MVSLLVMVDSGVVGGPMASLHHLVTDLHGLQAGDQHHQMYTDMQTVIVTPGTTLIHGACTGIKLNYLAVNI